MDTFELLPSLAQGELGETSAPELVAAVFRSRASGTLWLETSNEIRCFFRAGDMCGTASFKGFQTLAHVLLANDWVDALDIDSSREEAASKNQRHGEILIAKGLLTPDQLRTALGAQHTANLKTLLLLTSGKYDWRGWEPPPPWAREVVVDPVSCLVDALEQDQHAVRRKKVLDWLGRTPARLSLDWPELQGRVTLGALDRRAAALLALPRRLDEFVQASRLPQTRAEALLVAMLLAGGAEPQPTAGAAPQAEPEALDSEAILEPEPVHDPILEPLPEPAAEDELRPDELHQMPQPPPVSSDPFAEPNLLSERPLGSRLGPRDEAEAVRRLEALSLDDVQLSEAPIEPQEEPLEIDHRPRSYPSEGGDTASQTLMREEPTFDHTLHREPSGGEDPRNRDLRKKLMARGMRNLGNLPAQATEPEGAVVAPASRPGRLQLDESKLSDEDLRFVDEVRSRAKLAQRQNAYARLGVSPQAPADQIKAAYLALAKRFHPDAASKPGLTALTPELQSLFGSLKEAYESISTADLRAKYDAQNKNAGNTKSGNRKEESILAMKMGDVLLKKRDFEGALTKLRRAVDLDASGDALAALAWALVADPKATAATKEEAASLINRALRAQGATARTYYVAGVLWRTKDPDSAVDAFRKALEIDPNHSDAALELRLIEQRRGKTQKSGGGVLSGLLFGKRKS
ncbi:MAG: DnaJ domain-containing protein [Myxococcales bacterium]|nr:DnaJ domain-containing protein [Myxococcales bacterium]